MSGDKQGKQIDVKQIDERVDLLMHTSMQDWPHKLFLTAQGYTKYLGVCTEVIQTAVEAWVTAGENFLLSVTEVDRWSRIYSTAVADYYESQTNYWCGLLRAAKPDVANSPVLPETLKDTYASFVEAQFDLDDWSEYKLVYLWVHSSQRRISIEDYEVAQPYFDKM